MGSATNDKIPNPAITVAINNPSRLKSSSKFFVDAKVLAIRLATPIGVVLENTVKVHIRDAMNIEIKNTVLPFFLS